MNWVDLLIIGALIAALITGFRRGALMQLFSWGGFLVGLFIGGPLAPRIVKGFNPSSPFARAMITMAIFLGLAFIVEAVMAIAGHRLRARIHAPWAKDVDSVVGSLGAVMLSLMATWFLGVTLKQGPSQELSAAVRGSAIMRTLDRIAPRPPAFFAQIGRLLNQTGFPEVFAQLNPSLAPGVAPPPRALARDPEVLRAARLTFKIESKGCGGLVDGSGFPSDPHTMITAAHVVAGTRETRVIEPDGEAYRARVVYMNTDTDIAVLHVPSNLPGELRIDPDEAPRGTDGAAIGYPGGGPRTISVARVRARTNAIGFDIYSDDKVERDIYVLRATVRRGNSGGPFVDTDGRIRGMIFAASAGNSEESYALTEAEIRRALRRSDGRTSRVRTGKCAV